MEKMKSLKSVCIVGAITLAMVAGTVVGYSKDKKDKGDPANNNQNMRRSGGQGKGQPDNTPGNNPPGNNGLGNNLSGNGSGRKGGEDGPAATSNDKHGDGSPSRSDSKPDKGGKSQGDSDAKHDSDTKRDSDSKHDSDTKRDSGAGRDSDTKRDSALTKLTKHDTANGFEETSPSGKVRTRDEKKADGDHVTKFSVTGTKQAEEVRGTDGSRQVKRFDTAGHVRQEEVVHTDGSREVSNHQLGRDGNVRVKETVKYDVHEKIVSKTVVRNVNKVVIVNHYDRGRCGFVYHPVFVLAPIVAWYDPYWYSPVGVVIVHPFHYHWGWEGSGWYHSYYGPYWTAYDVYPAPSYWVTDWMVAGYMQDHYEAQMSVDQARADAQAARDEAARAQAAAQAAQDQAEIAEAKAAQAQAELQARNAEAKLAAAEHRQELAGKPNPNATPIDKDTKEALKNQIEQTVAEKKVLTEQAEKGGNPVIPDVSKAFADPKHVYPVSKVVSVTSAKDSNPAGNLSEGDLLRIEPGQEDKLKNATENDLITMRVMTSKGEDGEVPAGTQVNVSVHDLQDFDSEFRAKVDAGVEEAGKNKDAFKKDASNG